MLADYCSSRGFQEQMRGNAPLLSPPRFRSGSADTFSNPSLPLSRSSSRSAPRAFPDITADIRNEIEDIREEESLEPETIEELAEELKRIEAAADPADPGTAIDAAERLRERVAALLELNSETLKRIVQDSDALARIANTTQMRRRNSRRC